MLKMSRISTLFSVACLVAGLTLPVLSSSASNGAALAEIDVLNSAEIAAPVLYSQSAPLFLSPPENAVLVTVDSDTPTSSVDLMTGEEETSDSRTAAAGIEEATDSAFIVDEPLPIEQTENSKWNVPSFSAASDPELETESAPTITPEDVIQQTQAIPIESYVATGGGERRPKSDSSLLLLTGADKEEEFGADPSLLDLPTKNLTSDPEDLENALFNDTAAPPSAAVDQSEGVDQSKEASEESLDFATKETFNDDLLTTTTTTTTPLVSIPPPQTVRVSHQQRKKQPKYIKKFRASASEVLRFFMEGSYLRSPLAVLVDTSDKTLEKTKILWNATLQQSSSNIDMVLMTFDHSGIYATYKFNNSRTLVAGLNSIQPSSLTDHEISTHTDNVFSTIIRASERIPYDSAIFLFTNSEPVEDEVAQTAAIMLLKKRIRLYLFWFGGVDTDPESGVASATQNRILGDVTLRTGGEIVYMSGEAIHPNGDIGTVTLQLRNMFQGVQPFGTAVPESETNVVNRSHESSEEGAKLAAAAGAVVPGEETSTSSRDRSNTSNGTAAVKADVEIFQQRNQITAHKSEDLRFPDNSQQTSVLENEEATSNAVDIDQTEDNLEDVEIVSPQIDSRQSAASIEGNTQVQISVQSKLQSLPGSNAQIYFEVTNLRTVASYYYFVVNDELNFVRQTQLPIPVWVQPGQTVTVTVNLFIPITAVAGQRNKVTFTARGVTDVQQSVFFTVSGQNTIQDSWAPYVTWNYGSRCEFKTTAGVCSQHVWSVEITAQDSDSGVIRMSSSPRGLLLRNAFTAGTREVVTGTYSASCCQPRLTVTVYDAANNSRIVNLDVTDPWLSEAGIAAVVLGVLLFILLVALAVVLCVWCRRRKQAQELPVYRSRTRSRQERTVAE